MTGPHEIRDVLRLTPLQRGMLFHTLLSPEAGDYVTQLACRLRGPLDPARFQEAWNRTLARHDALRTAFVWEGVAEPVQVVMSAADLPLENLDWSRTHDDREERLTALLAADRGRPFDLRRAPLMRITLARLGQDDWQLLWTAHHLLFDGWSLPVLWQELWSFYANGDVRLPATHPFRDYLLWLEGRDVEEARSFWRGYLAAHESTGRLAFVRPAAEGDVARDWRDVDLQLGREETHRLQAAARSIGATTGTFVVGAWGLLLGRSTGDREIVVGTTRSGRPHDLHGAESMVGMFINTVPTRVTIDEDLETAAWLQRLQEDSGAIAAREWFPLTDILEASGMPSAGELFETLVVFENYPFEASDGGRHPVPELTVEDVRDLERTNFPLNLVVTPGEDLHLRLSFDGRRVREANGRELLTSLAHLLRELPTRLHAPLERVAALAPEQDEKLLRRWADGGPPCAEPEPLHAAFEAQVERTPRALACEDGTEALDYRSLDERAERLASVLRSSGAGPGTVVALRLDPTCDLVVAALATAKSGAAWLLLDPSLPDERSRALIADARPCLVIESAALAESCGLPRIDPRADTRGPAVDAPPRTTVGPEDLAYLVYTSGSTGRPKAVAVPHRGLANLARATASVAGLGPGRRVAQLAAQSFDVTVLEMVSTLLSGATLCLLSAAERVPGPTLSSALARRKVDTLMLSPSVLRTIEPDDVPCVTTLLVGGESLTSDLARRWRDRRLVHSYGPAEASVTATHQVLAPDEDDPSIGNPLPGVRAYVLDAALRPVVPGGTGELYLGGIGIARGYHGRPALTAERFLPDPYSASPGSRLYRTGDRVRWVPREDGSARLSFIGRADEQVKVRGVRIEPGEVERTAMDHPGVREAACDAVDAGGDAVLVLWYACRQPDGLEPRALRRFLLERLPLSLVPNRLIPLAALPVSANGKLDRAALPRPSLDGHPGETRPPRTALQRWVAAAFASVLQRDQLGLDDDFFELGGHSLRAIQLASRIRADLGLELPLRALYENTTVDELSSHLASAGGSAPDLPLPAAALPPVEPCSVAVERRPLSLAQKRLWFLDRLEPDSALYLVPVGLRLSGPLDEAALERALQRLVERHAILRTAFDSEDGEPFQTPRSVDFQLSRAHLEPGETEKKALTRLAREPFDLASPPLVRGELLKATAGEHVLLLVFHHIVADGWSLGILVDELAALYGEESGGAPASLPPLDVQYADYARWQSTPAVAKAIERDVEHAKARLEPLPEPLELPERGKRPPEQTYVGTTLSTLLSPGLRERVERLARETETTPFVVLFSAFSAWLGRLCGREELLVGTPVAGRERAELEPLVGLFVNTLPLRADLAGDPDLLELLRRMRDEVLEAQSHQQAPFERLVEELAPERDLSRPPLVQVLFAFQNFRLEAPTLPRLDVEPLELDTDTAKFDLSAFVDEAPEKGWRLSLEYNTDLFAPETVEVWLRSLVDFLARLLETPERRLSALALADDDEVRLLVEDWGRAPATHPREPALPELFAAVVARQPTAPAVVYEGDVLTYGELAARARRLARELLARGATAETHVAIACERSLDLIVAIVAVIEAGAAYVPLDPLYPAERREWMLADSGATILLTHASLAGEPSAATCEVLCLDDPRLRARIDEHPADALQVACRPDQLAYAMYTSGSTGQPKCVGVEHRAVVRLLCGEPFLRLGPEEIVLQFVSSAFDVSVWEIWGALLSGARLEVFQPHKPSLAELGSYIRSRGITTMWLTTGLFHQMVDECPEDLRGVRQLMAGGEALSPPHVRRALDRLPDTRIVNGYGPTELSCFTTTHTFSPTADLSAVLAVPIGKPTGGARVYVLDAALRPMPRGAWGELYGTGAALARGYLNDPRLTAERFLPDPFADEPGARMYRIGDRARWLADGTLEYGGRVDRQVKVRGFRLELGEVEAALDELPEVKKSVVELQGEGEAKHLVAWVVSTNGHVDPEIVRKALRRRLPEPMVPSRFRAIDRLPLTPNGKLDRRALPAFDEEDGDAPGARPRGPEEELLASLWRRILWVKRPVSRQDDFFALGGHSLLATQLMVRIRDAFGVELALQEVFRHPRLEALAAVIADRRGRRSVADEDARPVLQAGPQTGDRPLSFGQERLWFLARYEPGDPAHHTPFGVDLDGPLDTARLQTAFKALVERHAILRTSFPEVDGAPVQRVQDRSSAEAFELECIDLAAREADARARSLEEIQHRVANAAFDVRAERPWRATLVRLADERHVLLLCLHHLVCDGWSMAVFANDLHAAYDALVNDGAATLAPLRLQYADFAAWQRARMTPALRERERGWWQTCLEGAPERIELGRQRQRIPGGSRRTSGVCIDLPSELVERLEETASALSATPYMLHLAVLQGILGRLTGSTDFVVGSPIAGRLAEELEELIGMFVNLLPLRADLAGDPPFRELVARTRATTLEAYEHQELPIEELVDVLRPDRTPGTRGGEVFQVLFTLHNTPPASLRLGSLRTQRRGVTIEGAFCDLWLSIEPSDPLDTEDVGAHAYFHYDADVIEAHVAEGLAEAWRLSLEAVVEDPDRRLSDLPTIVPADAELVLSSWAWGADTHPRSATIDSAFAASVGRSPGATALSWEDGSWSYAELAARANRLARHLQALGVGLETRVGLSLERSPELVLAALAVLRAGGTYVPLAPDLPVERRLAMIASSGLSLLVTSEAIADELPVGLTWPVLLDAEREAIEAQSDAPLPDVSRPDSLAYVMYTSGTTGEPKAVGVEHRSVVRLVLGAPFVELGPTEVLLQFAPFAFDASTFEVWGALLKGARLEVFPPRQPSLEELGRFVRERQVTTLWLTATLFHQMTEERWEDLRGVKQLLAGGEALSPTHVRHALERLPETTIVNGYGPTECTTFAATHPIRRTDDLSDGVPLGRPIEATGVRVLDPWLRPVPPGFWGELYLAGAGLARGYLNDPRTTALRFVPDPFASEPGQRLYRTGDRVRFRRDGTLEFGGRLDRQVKLRGFRIEPAEIEAALLTHPAVNQAAVELRRHAEDTRLVAWFVARGDAPGNQELRSHLTELLPAPFVPTRYVALERLPVTPNGKLDRRALVEPDEEAPAGPQRATRPETELLCGLVADVLALPGVSPDADFFELGGHSLLATRLLSRVREAFAVELPLHVVFEHPRIEQLAARMLELRDASVATPPPRRIPDATTARQLSFGQERMWLLQELAPENPTYHVPFALELSGALVPAALARALDHLRQRHDVLRSRLVLRGERIVQEALAWEDVLPTSFEPEDLVDLTHLAPEVRDRHVNELAAEVARRPFALSAGDVLHARLLRTDAAEHVLLLSFHHVVCDAWSLSVFAHELGEAYRAYVGRREPQLAPLELQYADFAAWQREQLSGARLETEVAWWKERLAAAPQRIELARRLRRTPASERPAGLVRTHVSAELTAATEALAHREGATLFMTLLAVYECLIAQATDRRDFLIGTPVAGRTHGAVEGLIGLFVNTLALRAELDSASNFGEHLARVRATTLDAYAHQEVPFERVVEALEAQRDESGHALLQTLFALQNAPQAAVELDGLRITTRPVTTGAAHAELIVSMERDDEGGLVAYWEYDAGLFEPEEVEVLARTYQDLLAASVADPDRKALRHPTLAPAAASAWTARGRGPATRPACADAGLWSLFAATVTGSDAPAIVNGERTVGRAELLQRAVDLAGRLAAAGARRGDAVGLLAEDGEQLAVGALGILRAGGAYVPLDPDTPAERISRMLDAAHVEVVVTTDALLPALSGIAVRTLAIDGVDTASETGAALPSPADICGAEPGYIVFTSGSTGTPKGVRVSQGAVARLVLGTDYVRLSPGHRVARLANPGFDALTFELWGALLTGATLVEIGRDVALTPELLERTLRARDITHLFLTTALFEELAHLHPTVFAGLDTVLFGGERHSVARLAELFAAGAPPRRLLHMYGPSEATTYASAHPIVPAELGSEAVQLRQAPIGAPIAETELFVLDDQLRPVPDGLPGELFVGGSRLADGYVGDPAQTAERFLPDPFSERPGARLYRTGDRVRRDHRGALTFLGRFDAQLKLRGFRIEPGEIETCLRAHPQVRAAFVDLASTAHGSSERLVAWFVPQDGAPDTAELRAHVARLFPPALVPSAFVALHELPLNRNGKIDRSALPAPPAEAESATTIRAGSLSPVHELVAGVVADVLEREHVPLDKGFFELGGHSLLATRVVARLSEALDRELPFRLIFEAPTLDAFARGVERLRRGDAAFERIPLAHPGEPREGPLSFAQERLWFLERLQPGGASYHVPLALRLRGELDRDAWKAAFLDAIRPHESFRTRISEGPAGPAQSVEPRLERGIEDVDLAGSSHAGAQALEAVLEDLAARPFEHGEEPLWRAALLSLGDADVVFVLVMHHAVADGWSLGRLIHEITSGYERRLSAANGVNEDVAAPIVQPLDHARWQRRLLDGPDGRERSAWWRNQLAGAPEVLDLPTDRPRPPVQALEAATTTLSFPNQLVARIRTFATEQAVTPFVVLYASLHAVLSRWSGQDDLCVGTPFAGRERAELESTFGFLVNTLPLRTTGERLSTFRELVRLCRTTVLDAFDHRDVPFEKIVDALGLRRDPGRNPVFQVMLALQDDLIAPFSLPGLDVEPLTLSVGSAKFDLTFALSHANDGLVGEVEYDAQLFDAATVRRLVRHWLLLVEQALAAPDTPLGTLSLASPEEEALVNGFASGPATVEAFEPVHLRFARRAAAAPDALAVTDERGSWSHAELAARSEALGAHLAALGIERGEAVGLCARRSRQLVSGALAVLREGAAYVLLDPEHPTERLRSMTADAGVRFVLVDDAGATACGALGLRLVDLNAEPVSTAARPAAAVGPEDLAYVVFTSGSTGRPKGVATPHRGLANLVDWHVRAHEIEAADRATLLAGTSFDASVWELWPYLATGASLFVVPETVRTDPPRLASWMAANEVSVTFLPTPLAEALLARGWNAPGAPRRILTGGDRLRVRPGTDLPFTLVNQYGPSEASVVATWGVTEPAPAGTRGEAPSIGRPVDGAIVRVLDDDLRPLPVGLPGELYVGGRGVAHGYVGNPRTTAACFVPDPLAEQPGTRLYRTGDRAAWLADGSLRFLGRLDDQIQVRGYRVEPGEIEVLLLAEPSVDEAAVLARATERDELRLTAYVTPAQGHELSVAALRTRLGAALPSYMVPAEWVVLDELPKNASGKLDRRALPAPQSIVVPARSFSPPRGPLEQALARVWGQVLGLELVSRNANFFDLGGHSLALLDVQTRIARELDHDVPVVELFQRPTIADLAAFLSTAPADVRQSERGARRGERRRARRGKRRTGGGA